MTVETTTYFTEWQDANGVNKNWVYNFPIPDDNSVSILVRDVATPLIVDKFTSDFTRVEVDENNGTIIYPVLGAALGATKQVRIVRDVPYTQMTQIGSEGAFNPEIHEKAMDKLTMICQQLFGAAERSLRFPLGDSVTELPSVRAGRVLAFDVDGNPVAGPSLGEISSAVGYATAAAGYRDQAEASAVAAAASVAEAALWDPANYYTKTDFKDDGTANAPVKYRSDGGLMAKAGVWLDGAANQVRALMFSTAGALRWRLRVDNSGEPGADAGSDLSLRRTVDSGTEAPVLNVSRASGVVAFVASPTAPTPTAGDNSTKLATTAFVAAAITAALASAGGQPVGSLLVLPSMATPSGGYLLCNGAVVDRTTYSGLDTALYVGDALNATAHAGYRCTNAASPTTSRSTTGQYIVLPDLRGVFLRGLDESRGFDPSRMIASYQADMFASHNHTVTIGSSNGQGLQSNSVFSGSTYSTSAVGGTETRPKNVAVRFWIKY